MEKSYLSLRKFKEGQRPSYIGQEKIFIKYQEVESHVAVTSRY